MKFITINGQSLSREPTSIEQSRFKLKKENRTIDGTLVVDIIAIKTKVKVQWDYITSADLMTLQNLVFGGGFLNISYRNGEQTATMQAEASNLALIPHYDSKTKSILWKEVSIEFNEV